MEFKEKKKSKKKLFTVSIIIFLAVGLFAYFDREKFCWALLIIGCIAYSEWGVKFVKKKLDKIDKEGYMLTGAVAVVICLVMYIIGVVAFHRMYEEKGKREIEDIKQHYDMTVPTYGISIIEGEDLEEALGEKYYSEFYLMQHPGKNKEWADEVNKCLDDIVGDRKKQ
ncbi:MAG: hypothetical protein KH260_08020 [Lachnospiraceae bacterium oral taxon 082]|nr:hypothetical protein [Lachnospiraceae bacterium oral taxon 082]